MPFLVLFQLWCIVDPSALARTFLVSLGSITPSSQSLAVEYQQELSVSYFLRIGSLIFSMSSALRVSPYSEVVAL